MKRALCSMLTFVSLTSSIAFAEAAPGDKKEIYATTQDVLLDMLSPYITRAVHEECGKDGLWELAKVNGVALQIDHTAKPAKMWYEVKLMIRTTQPSSGRAEWSLDTVVLHVDTKTYFQQPEVQQTELEDVSVKVVSYVHNHGKEQQQ